MIRDRQRDAALALHRFGLGPRPGAIAAIASDPRGALIAELDRPGAGRIDDPALPGAAASARAASDARAARNAQRVLAARAEQEAERLKAERQAMGAIGEEAAQSGDMVKESERKPAPPLDQGPTAVERQMFLREVRARLDAALVPETGFAERLVWFWSNHFCVSADKVPNMAGAYEREAIRPHVLGRYADMLLVVESHPAMLVYLDNAASIGPGSVAGINRSKGLNENLAREILELHTLGAGSGYTQDDVTRFACVLTGWTVLLASVPEHGGEFIFSPRMHEPGPQRVLGKTYDDAGTTQGRAVLADLARHPATAAHVARKLARSFVADRPPPPLVERLEKIFRDTEGDLKAVARGLIMSEEAWAPERTKLKRPYEWVIAMLRAAGARGDPERFLGGQRRLGEPLWRPPSPKGFDDGEAAWIDGLGQRLDIASIFAGRVADRVDPRELIETALGPLVSTETRQAVARAESRQQALTLAFMSPEFQRR
jgi:uncharacterized protein (DUF1800 family)